MVGMAGMEGEDLEPSRRRRLGTLFVALALALPACSTSRRPAPPAHVMAPDAGRGMPPEPTPRAAAPAHAPRPGAGNRIIVSPEGPLEVAAGQSLMLHLNADAGRVSIADPDVAEVVLISPREVVVNGKGRKVSHTQTNFFTGSSASEDVINEAQTSVIVWDRAGHSDVRTLYINRSRPEQILLEVTIADVNRTAVEQYGFDFQVLQKNILVSGTPSKLFNFTKLTPLLNAGATTVSEELNVNSDRLTYMINDLDNNFLAFLELLQQENLAKILARPMLLARSGEEAHLRVGGEVPVPFATQNVVQVNYKEFGVLLGVTPTLTDDGQIDLRIGTEVSEPSFVFQSQQVGGFTVPSFISRRVDTRVRLRENEPLMIGGLYREDTTELERKVPYLGDLPYLGYFFRHTEFQKSRNELLILVKPRVARAGEELMPTRLPTDRPPLSRSEVRTQRNPYGVTRPRLVQPPSREEPAPGSRPSVDSYLPPQSGALPGLPPPAGEREE
jgi:pilus assembly protein CpaC